MVPLILLVDDERPIRALVVMCLQKLPIEIIEANSVWQAKEKMDEIAEAGKTVDLLITDWSLQDGKGQSVLDKATDLFRCRSIVITSELREDLGITEDIDYLQKPFKLTALYEHIVTTLDLPIG